MRDIQYRYVWDVVLAGDGSTLGTLTYAAILMLRCAFLPLLYPVSRGFSWDWESL
jgi:hypothetical protein